MMLGTALSLQGMPQQSNSPKPSARILCLCDWPYDSGCQNIISLRIDSV
jgi:hypothetical protein